MTSDEAILSFYYILSLDLDNNKALTVQEYVAMPENSDVDSVNDIWVRERRNEFREVIDADKDGIVTVEELEVKIYLVIL